MSRRIVITGASSEIGQAICERVVGEDDEIILQCHRRCTSLQERLGAVCDVVSVDFTDQNALDEFCCSLGKVDILINVAAVMWTDLLADLEDEQIEDMIAVNIVALIKLCRAVLSGMAKRRNGTIVNISSVAARRGNRGQSVYAGTKGFVESFTRSLAAEYGKRNVRINCVAPGPIKAGSLNELLGYAMNEASQSVTVPRLGTPRDVAAVVAFLCSEDAAFITGTCISVDGGFYRGV